MQELMNRYYTDWLEQSIPALGGLTPRQAVRTREGRAQVEVLLKGIENHAARGPVGAAPDVGRLRRELGLEG